MDRLLREIQVDLQPDREPAPALAGSPTPPAVPPAAPPEPVAGAPERATASDVDRQIQALTDLSGRLLASMRELLAGYERVLTGAPAKPVRMRPDPPDATVSAGPFPSIEALRTFKDALSRLPGVRDVELQAYEGADHAILEVRLDHSST